jgi:F-type H+-transporting ATPase subunit delta
MKRSIDDYAEALDQAVRQEPSQLKETVRRFLDLLRLDRNHQLLPLIINQLENIEAKRLGQLRVSVTTAQALTAGQRQQLIKSLKQKRPEVKTVSLIESVEPSVLGGIRLVIGDQTIDHTIKMKLDQLAVRL